MDSRGIVIPVAAPTVCEEQVPSSKGTQRHSERSESFSSSVSSSSTPSSSSSSIVSSASSPTSSPASSPPSSPQPTKKVPAWQPRRNSPSTAEQPIVGKPVAPSSEEKPNRIWGNSVLRKGTSPQWRERQDSAPTSGCPWRSGSSNSTIGSPPRSSKIDIGARFAQARFSAPATATTTTAAIPHPTLDEARVGQVFFLPAEKDISAFSKAFQNTHGSPWEHPVVVISKNLAEKTVTCRICTSFTRYGSSGIKNTTKSTTSRKQFLLCENTDKEVSTHDGTQLLTMEAGSEIFPKATYVSTVNDTLTIEYCELIQYKTQSGKPIIFSEGSMALLY